MPVRRALLLAVAALLLGLALPAPGAYAAPKSRRGKVEKKALKDDDGLPPSPPPPPQAPPSPALPHIVAGNKAFEAGQYEVAIKELKAAYAIDPIPRVLFNLASAQRRAGQYREAQASYREYLKVDPNGELKDKATAYIGALDEAIVEKDRRERPFYKKAWFWGVVGGVVVAAGVGVGLGLGLKPSLPQTDKGIYVLNF